MSEETETPRTYEWIETAPLPDAVLNDWRFYDYVLTIQETTKEKGHRKYSPVYSSSVIRADNTKVKGKKAKNADILFCLPVIQTAQPTEEN